MTGLALGVRVRLRSCAACVLAPLCLYGCLSVESPEGAAKTDAGSQPDAGVGDAGWPCQPTTCAKAGADCGELPDGCGDTITCGSCGSGLYCGGGGPNVCGTAPCTPTTCGKLGAECGVVSDGCGNALSCGSCAAPDTCGGAGVANQCGCKPGKSCPPSATCGSVDDGCGKLLSCGSCPGGTTCGSGKYAYSCVGVEGTWVSLGRTCDGASISDTGVTWTFMIGSGGALLVTTQDTDCKRTLAGSWSGTAASWQWSLTSWSCQPEGCKVGPGGGSWESTCVSGPNSLQWQGTYTLGAEQMTVSFAAPAMGCNQSGTVWTLSRQ